MDIFQNIIIEAAKKSSKNNSPIDTQDYSKDGITYCGQCNTPKQVEVLIMGQLRRFNCMCQCQKEEWEEEQRQFEIDQRKKRIPALRAEAFPTIKFLNYTFANDDGRNKEAVFTAKRYADNFEEFRKIGKGLLLYGEADTGKTYLAVAIANKIINQGYSARFETFTHIIQQAQMTFGNQQKYIEMLNKYDLLVIDDFGTERNTEYTQEIIFDVINNRYNLNKPIIVTTNLTKEQMNINDSQIGVTGQRLLSRFYEMCFFKEVKGERRRGKQGRQDLQKYKDLLGL